MTEQEAINVFKGFKFTPRELKAVEMGISALEKQIPKEPIITMENPKCPKCEYPFYFGCIDNYCVSCGQAIKWDD